MSAAFRYTPALLTEYPASRTSQANNAVAGGTSYSTLEAFTALLVSIVSIRTNIGTCS
jgi:hypothetical protein